MLIDGMIKQLPTATVDIDMSFYEGRAKVICMDNLVQEVMIGNIPGVIGLRQHSNDGTKVMVCCDAIDKIMDGS